MAVVCPSIGLDHQDILGDTYADIAYQKAGVLKGSEDLIFAIDNKEARQVFLKSRAAWPACLGMAPAVQHATG